MIVGKLRKVKNLFSNHAIVLCYHRIASMDYDPWTLAVSAKNFEQHLRIISKNYRVVSPDRLLDLPDNVFGSRTICITFDDGYTDNLTNASQLLKKYGLPACFFISSGYIGKPYQYWWDEISTMILESEELPSILHLHVNGQSFSFDNTGGESITPAEKAQMKEWKAKNRAINKRCELYSQLWNFIMPLTSADRHTVLVQLRKWAVVRTSDVRISRDILPMDQQQLKMLASDPLFTIGLHTTNHVALDKQVVAVQEEEIASNRAMLEETTGQRVNTISFPFGRYNDTTLQVLNRLNLDSAFTSEKKVVGKYTNPHKIGRFAVGNWDGQEFKKRLDTWFGTAETPSKKSQLNLLT